MNKMENPMDSMGDEMMPRSKSVDKRLIKKIAIIVIAIIIIVAAAKACWIGYDLVNGDELATVSSAEWQAVFLVNGQVYFGKVKALSKKTLTLSDIYYLQVVTKPLQSTQTGSAAANPDQNTSQELTLIKLGNEIHGPTDRMVINRDQIVLTEKLKNDSRVVQAIAKYLSDQKNTK